MINSSNRSYDRPCSYSLFVTVNIIGKVTIETKRMEKMQMKRINDRGFSLVELIIVMAIMAILLGIVGTQVVPYLERAREAKDMQIINSYCTAAVAAYSMNAELFAEVEDPAKPFDVYGMYDYVSGGPTGDNVVGEPNVTFITEIIELTGYADPDALHNAMKSKMGKTIKDLWIRIDWSAGTVTVQALDENFYVIDIVEPVVSHI